MARQKLGQHFLKNKNTLAFIAQHANTDSVETTIEIGPGHGELTKFLIPEVKKNNGKLFCIEKDKDFFETIETLLNREIGDAGRLFCGDVRDILPILPEQENLKDYIIIGNIPYYLTSFLLRIISNLAQKPHTTTLLIQKEVAKRIVEKPPRQNLLSAIIQSFADAKIIKYVPRGQFSPPPKVDSAVIQLTTHNKYKQEDTENYIKIVKIIFAHPRKTILKNLKEMEIAKNENINQIKGIFLKLGIPEDSRAQFLSGDIIMELAKMLYNEK